LNGRSWDDFDTDQALNWLKQQANVIAIAPSVLDNFPFTIIELFLSRIPFLATAVGGVEEIVGAGNANEILMPASVRGVRAGLERVLGEQRLTIDYSTGYSSQAVASRVVDLHQQLLSLSVPKSLTPANADVSWPIEAWVIHDATEDALAYTLRTLREHCQTLQEVKVLIAEELAGQSAELIQLIRVELGGGADRDVGVAFVADFQ
jgi:hypothetical protein